MRITKGLIKHLMEWAESDLEHDREHNVWHYVEEAETTYKGHEVIFSFEGTCSSWVKDGGRMIVEGEYCGDYDGEIVITGVEVQELKIYNEKEDEWLDV